MLRSLATGCALGLMAAACSASLLDDLGNLQGKVVIYVGEFEEVSCPMSGKYDCISWPRTMLKSKQRPEICLAITKYVQCGYSCKGLIAVGDDKRPKAFIFSAMSSDANEFDFERYRCPDPF